MDKATRKVMKKIGDEQLEAANVNNRETQNLSRTNVVIQKQISEAEKKSKNKPCTPTKAVSKRRRPRDSPAQINVKKANIVKLVESCGSNMQPDVQLVSIEREMKKDAAKIDAEKKSTSSEESAAKQIKSNDNCEQNGSGKKSVEVEGKENGVSNGKAEEQSKQNDAKPDSSSKDQKEIADAAEKKTQNEKPVEETSDISLKVEEVSQSEDKESQPMKPEDAEASFMSYDASNMLTEPKVKVNDNVQDNVKVVQEEIEPEKPKLNESFGRTLRAISGRRSINRTRNVELRDRVISPDDSLYVNISMSTPDDCKILRYRTGINSSIGNGSFVDRKRKISLEESPASKKVKNDGESSNLSNASFDFAHEPRRPIQVSTPNKLNASSDSKDKKSDEPAKRWCRVM